jgi:hypothetical protein
MENSNDTIGNRTRDLPACSAVPQHNNSNTLRKMQFKISVSSVAILGTLSTKRLSNAMYAFTNKQLISFTKLIRRSISALPGEVQACLYSECVRANHSTVLRATLCPRATG